MDRQEKANHEPRNLASVLDRQDNPLQARRERVDEGPSAGKRRNRIKSCSVFLGIALFLLSNAVLNLTQPLAAVDPESLPSAHTWVWWATQDFLSKPSPQDIVIVGASTLMHPLARMDADFLNREFDYVNHHQSEYLESMLEEKLNAAPLSCFNFALPGAMVSDDYMLIKGLLRGKRKPSLIILGTGLRDFCDCLVTCPAATPPFKYFKRYASIDDIVELCMPHPWQRLDYLLGKLIYAHGRKLDLQVAAGELCKRLFWERLRKAFPPCRLAECDPSRNTPGNMRAEVEAGMYIVRPNLPYTFEDNTGEYKRRYRSQHESMFRIQSEFLERIMGICRREKIHLILVNIPVTDINKQLMPHGYYARYVNLLKSATERFGFRFLDLGDDRSFNQTDFYDSVHMNSSGGRKFVARLVEAIASDSRATSALRSAAARSEASQQ